MSAYGYIRILLATIGFGATAVAALNVTVDPYGLFNLIEIRRFNADKPARDGSRTLKSMQLRLQQYDVVVLGTSRVQLGIDPASPVFGDARAFNLGLVDVNMHEVEGVVRYLLEHQSPRTVMIGVDLINFDANRAVNEDYAESGFNGASLLQLYVPRVLSSRAVRDSFATLVYNLAGANQPLFGASGALERPKDMRYDHREAFRHMIGYYAKWDFYTDFAYSAGSVRALQRALKRLLDRNVSVYLFFSPVHASQLEVMRLMGLYDDFERAKRDLVAMLADLNAGERLQLWDFSGYNSITLEPLPPPGSAMRMRWYWEQAHYTRATGDLMLARMLRREDRFGGVPDDFGLRLNSTNIEAHLSQIRGGRLNYHQASQGTQEIIADILNGG